MPADVASKKDLQALERNLTKQIADGDAKLSKQITDLDTKLTKQIADVRSQADDLEDSARRTSATDHQGAGRPANQARGAGARVQQGLGRGKRNRCENPTGLDEALRRIGCSRPAIAGRNHYALQSDCRSCQEIAQVRRYVRSGRLHGHAAPIVTVPVSSGSLPCADALRSYGVAERRLSRSSSLHRDWIASHSARISSGLGKYDGLPLSACQPNFSGSRDSGNFDTAVSH